MHGNQAEQMSALSLFHWQISNAHNNCCGTLKHTSLNRGWPNMLKSLFETTTRQHQSTVTPHYQSFMLFQRVTARNWRTIVKAHETGCSECVRPHVIDQLDLNWTSGCSIYSQGDLKSLGFEIIQKITRSRKARMSATEE